MADTFTAEALAAGQKDIEERLTEIWKEILKLQSIGLDENFFEVGGHSLKAIELESRIRLEFNVNISLENIFSYLTIRELSDYIRNSKEDEYSPIKQAPQMQYYPISWPQKHIYSTGLESSQFSIIDVKFINQPVDEYKLEMAFKNIIKRHEILRTTFTVVNDIPVQVIHDDNEWFSLIYQEASEDMCNNRAFIEKVVNEVNAPYNLQQLPLIRVGLVRFSEEKLLIVISIHHIISDAFSFALLYRELDCMSQGRLLPRLNLQYKDYCYWQKELEGTAVYEERRKFWLDLFSGEISVLKLPQDYKGTNQMHSPFRCKKINIGNDIVLALHNLAKRYKVTLGILLSSAFFLFLSRYSGQEDITIGLFTSQRYSELDNCIGNFVRPVPIRIKVNTKQQYDEFVKYVGKTYISVLENQECDLDEIEEVICSKLGRNLGGSPLYNVTLNVHTEQEAVSDDMLPDENEESVIRNTIDIWGHLYFLPSNEICFMMEYNTELFSKATMDRMGEHFLNLLQSIIENPECCTGQLCMLSETEKNKILYEFNSTVVPYPKEKSIPQRIEEQAGLRPNDVAVLFEGEQLTYKELNEKSNRLAHWLIEQGIRKNNIIGIMAERSLDLMIGIVGILKSGAAYVSIDPGYPEERINYLLNNSNMKVLLTQSKFKDKICKLNCKAAIVDEVISSYPPKIENPDLPYDPQRLMYLLYTSGSTGTPKGAMIQSDSFMNLLNWFTREFQICTQDRVLLIASTSFDLAQKNLFAPLITGGRLYLFSAGLYDYNRMSEMIENECITIINCTPSAFYPLVELNEDSGFSRLKSLKWVFLGGEPINVSKLEQWLASPACSAEVVNTYGPTECTDIATFYKIKRQEYKGLKSVPIGKPIDNVRIYILDRDMGIVPVGVEGELCIGGEGVGRGYFNDGELTSQKFVHNPFIDGDTIYKTGDLAKWFDDGNIEFRGRVDHQVKIRGYRIEPEEVETHLLKHELVKDAIVIVREFLTGEKYLCAYFVAEKILNDEDMREYLSLRLPSYTIPDYFVQLDCIPLTVNGKVDRKALPEPKCELREPERTEPVDDIERSVIEICKKVLKVEKIGVNENLFTMGANSLKIILIASKLGKEFETSLPTGDIYSKPTVAAIAEYIRNGGTSLPFQDDPDMVLLKRGRQDCESVFFIHDISGSVDAYLELSSLLDNRYGYFGIRSEKSFDFSRRNITIEDIADRYIIKMKSIQPVGPYHIAGWSMGGMIAFEMARQLELAGDEIGLLALIDSTPPDFFVNKQTPADLQELKEYLENVIQDNSLKIVLREENSVYGVHKAIISYFMNNDIDHRILLDTLPKDMINVIPAYARDDKKEFLYQLNLCIDIMNAASNYKPEGKVFSPVNFIKAAGSTSFDEERWNRYFYSPVIFHKIDGDHYSIFKQPNIIGLAEVFSGTLGKD